MQYVSDHHIELSSVCVSESRLLTFIEMNLVNTYTNVLQQHKHINIYFPQIDNKQTTYKQVKVIYRRMKTAKGGKEYERGSNAPGASASVLSF